MEIQQAIKIRRSIRAYGDRPVEREKLEAVLRAGNQAPIFGRLHMSVFAGPEQLQAVDAAAVASWGGEAVAWAVGAGLLSSSDADLMLLSPDESATRAQVAVMLQNFAEKYL